MESIGLCGEDAYRNRCRRKIEDAAGCLDSHLEMAFKTDVCACVFVSLQLRDCDMGAIVNRDLQQRIRPINGLTLHQQVAKSDIKNAAKTVQNFDNRWKMWDGDTVSSANCSHQVSFEYTEPVCQF